MPKREVEGFGLGHRRAGRRAAALVSKTPDSTQKPAVETIHENVLKDIDSRCFAGLGLQTGQDACFPPCLGTCLFNNAGTIEPSTKGASKIDSQPDVARRSIIEEAEVKQCQAK